MTEPTKLVLIQGKRLARYVDGRRDAAIEAAYWDEAVVALVEDFRQRGDRAVEDYIARSQPEAQPA